MRRASINQARAGVSGIFRRIQCLIAGLMLVTFCSMEAGCAASKPSLDQPRLRNKLELRLQSALGVMGVGEALGDYIRVSVRMKSEGTDEDLAMLNQFGVAGAFLGSITTLTIEPSKIVEVAALDRVVFIELESKNVPKPTPPPSPAEGMMR